MMGEEVVVPEWEVFKRKRVALRRNPSVTIGKQGALLLSPVAWQLLDEAETVDLMFDPDRRVIGIRPSAASNAFRVSGYRERSKIISGRAFLAFYDIEWRSMRFPAFMHDDVLCIDVSEAGLEVSSNASKS
jgi:hypothetical protein